MADVASDAGCISTTSDASIAVPCYLLANMLSPRDSSGDGKHHQIENELVAVLSFPACAGPRTRNSLSDYIRSFPWCISMKAEDLAFLAVLYGYYLVLSSLCFLTTADLMSFGAVCGDILSPEQCRFNKKN